MFYRSQRWIIRSLGGTVSTTPSARPAAARAIAGRPPGRHPATAPPCPRRDRARRPRLRDRRDRRREPFPLLRARARRTVHRRLDAERLREHVRGHRRPSPARSDAERVRELLPQRAHDRDRDRDRPARDRQAPRRGRRGGGARAGADAPVRSALQRLHAADAGQRLRDADRLVALARVPRPAPRRAADAPHDAAPPRHAAGP